MLIHKYFSDSLQRKKYIFFFIVVDVCFVRNAIHFHCLVIKPLALIAFCQIFVYHGKSFCIIYHLRIYIQCFQKSISCTHYIAYVLIYASQIIISFGLLFFIVFIFVIVYCYPDQRVVGV